LEDRCNFVKACLLKKRSAKPELSLDAICFLLRRGGINRFGFLLGPCSVLAGPAVMMMMRYNHLATFVERKRKSPLSDIYGAQAGLSERVAKS